MTNAAGTGEQSKASRSMRPVVVTLGVVVMLLAAVIVVLVVTRDDEDSIGPASPDASTTETPTTIEVSTTELAETTTPSATTESPATTGPAPTTEPPTSTTDPPHTTTPSPGPPCDVGLPAGDEIVACRIGREGIESSAIVRSPTSDGDRWYATASPMRGSETTLSSPTELEALLDVISFTADAAVGVDGDEPNVRCLLVVPADRAGWRETCWGLGDGPTPATMVTMLDDRLVQLDLDETGTPVGAFTLDERVWASSGCDLTNARAITRVVVEAFPWAMLSGLRCDGAETNLLPESPATGVASAGSVFLQSGAPDGSLFALERVDGAWSLVNHGTGLAVEDWPIPAHARWTSWPGDTAPVGGPQPTDELDASATMDLDAVSELVRAWLQSQSAGDPEFPVIADVVDVVPGWTPLIVVRATVGGDDSVGGVVDHLWLQPVFGNEGQVGWEPAGRYRSFECLRGVAVDAPLCV